MVSGRNESMKVRNGFVSNSSSSSFIVATKKDQHLKAIVEVDINDLVQYSISSVEEAIDYITEDYCFRYDDWDKYMTEDSEYFDKYAWGKYNEILELIEDGYTVHCGVASSEGDSSLEIGRAPCRERV